MNDNTRFLKALLSQDWETYESLVADFEKQGIGTPIAIIGATFHLAIRRNSTRFQNAGSIIQFVANARANLAEGHNLPTKEAEALIYATLDMDAPGVEETIGGLDVGTIAEIEGQLLFQLVTEENLSEDQLDGLLLDAEKLAQEVEMENAD